MISAGCVLPPPPPLPPPPLPTSSPFGSGDLSMRNEQAVTSASSADATAGSTPPASTTEEVTLVNNDHGLIKACVRRHSGSDGDGVGCTADPDEGLDLAVTWRDALSGVETLDDGRCAGEETGANSRRLSFLPGELADRGSDGDRWDGGVFGADVRWGSFALLTRCTVLVYTQPDQKQTAGTGRVAAGGNDPVIGSAGGWKAHVEHPIVDGLLIGGASTTSTFSPNIPKPPADLEGLFILTLLGATEETPGGSGPVVSIQSLRDKNLACRCPLESPEDGNRKEGGVTGRKLQGGRLYVSPGYGGGVFVAAAEGADGECARVWRGCFDEGACRLEMGLSRVITSYPWPEPETLRLQGVAGPNCELCLFKEVRGVSRSVDDGADAGTSRSDRWWMTWPEADIWNCVDAPATLGEEELSVQDFVNIYQLEIEGMMISYDNSAGDGGFSSTPTTENIDRVGVAADGAPV